ncbi:MAG: hypothetical protein ACYDBX_03580 [Patescibacteria group bacterium]
MNNEEREPRYKSARELERLYGFDRRNNPPAVHREPPHRRHIDYGSGENSSSYNRRKKSNPQKSSTTKLIMLGLAGLIAAGVVAEAAQQPKPNTVERVSYQQVLNTGLKPGEAVVIPNTANPNAPTLVVQLPKGSSNANFFQQKGEKMVSAITSTEVPIYTSNLEVDTNPKTGNVDVVVRLAPPFTTNTKTIQENTPYAISHIDGGQLIFENTSNNQTVSLTIQ